MNTKIDNNNNNNEEKGNSNGKDERFGNEEDNAIEKKRHKSSKDQVRDIDKKPTIMFIHFQSSPVLLNISVNILPNQITILRW